MKKNIPAKSRKPGALKVKTYKLKGGKKGFEFKNILIGFLIWALVVFGLRYPLGNIAQAAPPVPAPNPSLAQTCGLDVALVIDSSGSIDATELGQLKNAYNNFVNILLPGTPTEFSVTEFDSVAYAPLAFTSDKTLITNKINAAASSGSTNWEDGLAKAWSTLPNRPNPNLIIFSSDGQPNKWGNNFGPGNFFDQFSFDKAVERANIIKNAGTRIITIGIGADVVPENLQAISSADAYYNVADFSVLATALQSLATELCGGTITVTKFIDADGNPETVNDQSLGNGWSFNVAGSSQTTDSHGKTQAVEITAGIYSVTETQKPGFDLISAICEGATGNGSRDGNTVSGIQVGNQDIVSCKFINTQNAGTLTVVKNVLNTNGGTAVPADFNIHVKSGGSDVAGSPQAGTSLGTVYSLAAGNYTVSEDAVIGYEVSFGDSCLGGNVTVANGQNVTCVITNQDQPARLTVIKNVDNSHGGTLTAGDFVLNVSGNNASQTSFPGSESGTEIILSAGNFSVTEPIIPAGYESSFSSGCDGTIKAGEHKTCTVTNNDKSTQLVVKKIVDHNGNTADELPNPGYFTITVTGGPSSVTDFPGSSGGSILNVKPGAYIVGEVSVENYTPNFSGDCNSSGNVVLGLGDIKTCVITNVYQALPPPAKATLTVVKKVVNNNGGVKTPADFVMHAQGTNVSSNDFPGSIEGTTISLDAGSFNVTETGPLGYSSFKQGCSGTLAAGEQAICTITNDDIPATLTVIKEVINDNGDVLTPSDFTIRVSNDEFFQDFPGSSSGTALTLFPGVYSVGEYATRGYTVSYSGDCNANGEVTLDLGQNKVCTVTNNDRAKDGEGGDSGADLNLNKTVDFTAPKPNDTIIYTLTVNNLGPNAATNIIATDTLPSNLSFISASSTQGAYNYLTGVWNIGTLPNGGSATLQIIASVNEGSQGQNILNSSSVSALEADPNLSNNSSSAGISVSSSSGGGGSSTGGGSTSSGGGGLPVIITTNAQVLGTSTVPLVGLAMPEKQGAILSASTELPRTGIPAFIATLILVGFYFGLMRFVFLLKNKN